MYDKGYAPKTIKEHLVLMSSISGRAVKDRIIAVNPLADVERPKNVRKKPNPFTSAEINTILTEITRRTPQMALFFAIGFFAGARTGEIQVLMVSDIKLSEKKISITKTFSDNELKMSTKTNKDRNVDILGQLEPYIEFHQQFIKPESEFLFTNRNGTPIRSKNTVLDYWKPVIDDFAIRYRQPYQTRHTFAVHMLKAREDPNWIKDMLGHETLAMLFNTYGNCYLPDDDRRAGSRFKLDVVLPNGYQEE